MLVWTSEERKNFGDPLYLSDKESSDFRFACSSIATVCLCLCYLSTRQSMSIFCLFCVCIDNADTWARSMRPMRAPAPPLWQEASTRRIATSECEGNCMRACAVCGIRWVQKWCFCPVLLVRYWGCEFSRVRTESPLNRYLAPLHQRSTDNGRVKYAGIHPRAAGSTYMATHARPQTWILNV